MTDFKGIVMYSANLKLAMLERMNTHHLSQVKKRSSKADSELNSGLSGYGVPYTITQHLNKIYLFTEIF